MSIPFFQDHILSLFQVDTLPAEKQKEFMDQMTDVLEQKILLRLLRELEGETKRQFVALVEAENQDELQAFVETHIPNLLTFVEEEALTFRKALLSRVGKA